VTLYETPNELRVPRLVESEGGALLAWMEADETARVALHAAILDWEQVAGSGNVRLQRHVELPFGFAHLGTDVPRDLFGTGSDLTSRDSLAVAVRGTEALLVANMITRTRSALSEFATSAVLTHVDLSTGMTRTTVLAPESPGAVHSLFAITSGADETWVSFLREQAGEEVQSDAYRMVLTGPATTDPGPGIKGSASAGTPAARAAGNAPAEPGGVPARAVNLTRTPRRVLSPVPVGGGEALLWLQEEPNASAYLPVYRGSDDAALAQALNLSLQGNLTETLAAAFLTVPLAAVMAVVWGVLGNLPLVALLYLAVTLVYRYAPELVRTQRLFVTMALFAGAAFLTGTPVISFAGPEAALLPRLVAGMISAAAVVAVDAVRARDRQLSERETVSEAILVVILVTALASYADLAGFLGSMNLLPAVL
jgi:hypothetical protein